MIFLEQIRRDAEQFIAAGKKASKGPWLAQGEGMCCGLYDANRHLVFDPDGTWADTELCALARNLPLGQHCLDLLRERDSWMQRYDELTHECAELKEENKLHRQKTMGVYWAWQGDGGDHLESLVCPVAIPAVALRGIIVERDAALAEVERLKEALAEMERLKGGGACP